MQGRCWYGDRCKFSHDKRAVVQVASGSDTEVVVSDGDSDDTIKL